MIRDPSDGTVREIPKSGPVLIAPRNNAERSPSSDAASTGPDTGIRQPTRTDAQERLERSREWLKQYHTKDTGHAGGNDGEKYQADGRAGNDQGEGKS